MIGRSAFLKLAFRRKRKDNVRSIGFGEYENLTRYGGGLKRERTLLDIDCPQFDGT